MIFRFSPMWIFSEAPRPNRAHWRKTLAPKRTNSFRFGHLGLIWTENFPCNHLSEAAEHPIWDSASTRPAGIPHEIRHAPTPPSPPPPPNPPLSTTPAKF